MRASTSASRPGRSTPGARLVEQQQRVLDEQRAGEQDSLALALGTGAEGAICQFGTAERRQDLPPADPIGLGRLAPTTAPALRARR